MDIARAHPLARSRAAAPWRDALVLGVATQLAQLALCLVAAAPVAGVEQAPRHALFGWDSHWYLSIAQQGYVSAIPPGKWDVWNSNVAFFPGYPLLGRLVAEALGLELRVALLAVARVAACAFWVLFYRLAARALPGRGQQLVAGALVACFPSAFYLQAAYAESLFLAALLAFLGLGLRERPPLLGAGAAALLMTSTRIVGVPLVLLGVLREGLRHLPGRPPWPALARHAAVAALGLAGAAAFFLHCHLRFGHWDLYMWTQRNGWGVQPSWGAVLERATWTLWEWPRRLDPFGASSYHLGRLSTSLSLWALVATAALEAALRRGFGVRGLGERLPFYLAAAGMLFVSVSGLRSYGFQSMVRYLLPVQVMLVLAYAHLWPRLPPRLRGARRLALGLALVAAAWQLCVQLHFLALWGRGEWVA